jgi:hypothetical protein
VKPDRRFDEHDRQVRESFADEHALDLLISISGRRYSQLAVPPCFDLDPVAITRGAAVA